MEQNQFEGLDEVEVEEENKEVVDTTPEYAKLLLLERDRQDYTKAVKLVEAGCFKQIKKNPDEVDFSKLEKIEIAKKYKGLYDLYRKEASSDLMFVLPLKEDNKGDEDEVKGMKPYAYDVIEIESMDEETYQAVIKAAAHNLSDAPRLFYKAGFITFFVLLGITVLFFIINMIYYSNQSVTGFNLITVSLSSISALLGFDACMVPLLCVASIQYKKYESEK